MHWEWISRLWNKIDKRFSKNYLTILLPFIFKRKNIPPPFKKKILRWMNFHQKYFTFFGFHPISKGNLRWQFMQFVLLTERIRKWLLCGQKWFMSSRYEWIDKLQSRDFWLWEWSFWSERRKTWRSLTFIDLSNPTAVNNL